MKQVVQQQRNTWRVQPATTSASPRASCYPSAAAFHLTFWSKKDHMTIGFSLPMYVKLTTDFTGKWMRKVRLKFYVVWSAWAVDSSALATVVRWPKLASYQTQKRTSIFPQHLSSLFIRSVDLPSWETICENSHRKATPTHKASDNTIPSLFLMDKMLVWFILLFLIYRQNIKACQCGVNWWFSGSNSAHSCMKKNVYIRLTGIYISVTEWRNCLVNSDPTRTLWKLEAQSKPCLNRLF